MKHKAARRKDTIIYREYVVTVSMPQILDQQKQKVAKVRAALAATFDRLETAAAELLPRACGMEIVEERERHLHEGAQAAQESVAGGIGI